MDNDDPHNQIELPASFVALYLPPGRLKPTLPRAALAERYELCEDMAQMLTDTTRTQQVMLGITESDVLQRCLMGLQADAALLSEAEAVWVVRRLAELLDWPADWS